MHCVHYWINIDNQGGVDYALHHVTLPPNFHVRLRSGSTQFMVTKVWVYSGFTLCITAHGTKPPLSLD